MSDFTLCLVTVVWLQPVVPMLGLHVTNTYSMKLTQNDFSLPATNHFYIRTMVRDDCLAVENNSVQSELGGFCFFLGISVKTFWIMCNHCRRSANQVQHY